MLCSSFYRTAEVAIANRILNWQTFYNPLSFKSGESPHTNRRLKIALERNAVLFRPTARGGDLNRLQDSPTDNKRMNKSFQPFLSFLYIRLLTYFPGLPTFVHLLHQGIYTVTIPARRSNDRRQKVQLFLLYQNKAKVKGGYLQPFDHAFFPIF